MRLVILVLAFFLALTFVRGLSVEAPLSIIKMSGTIPTAIPLTITNTQTQSQTFSFSPIGPFTLDFSTEEGYATIPGKSHKIITVYALPLNYLQLGDSFTGQIRVSTAQEEVFVPIAFTRINTPSFEQDENSHFLFTGLASMGSFSDWIVNGILLFIIFVLLIALVARIKNRVGG
ncbi:MAG: hypothetical protein V1776_05065 [Candidatus Diapherotrites archaeon]